MKLDRNISELLSIIERSTGLDSYTLIPLLIEDRLDTITWKPELKRDESGFILDVTGKIEIEVVKK